MRKISTIGLHHSASPEETSVNTITEWHLDRGFSTIGYNYVLHRMWENGPWTISVGRDISIKPAAHKWEFDRPNDTPFMNTNSIAICVCGDFTVSVMPDDCLELLSTFIAYLMKKYSINESNIFGHNQVKDTECPGYSIHMVRRAACLKLSELMLQ